jgi:hypothetical protein
MSLNVNGVPVAGINAKYLLRYVDAARAYNVDCAGFLTPPKT